MERNTETLNTRDLASPNEPGANVRTEDDVRDAAPADGRAGLHDQAAPAEERRQLPADEETRLPGDQTNARPAKSTQANSSLDLENETAPASAGAVTPASDAGGSLLPADMDETFQQRWKEIQTRFVDQPREAVEDADSLVANLMQQLAEGFAKERERLEAQWGRGEDISTEDLRVALQRYRTFFQRLLST